MSRYFLPLLPVLLFLAGCTVGPDFRTPDASVPPDWHARPAHMEVARGEVELSRWWQRFEDPLLTSLIERACNGNFDLRQAETRIRQARALSSAAAAGLWPTVDSSVGYRRSRSISSTSGQVVHGELYEAGFDASWEIDLFGGIRRSIEAAEADLRAAVEGRRDVLVSLTAELAGNYVGLRSLQQRLEIARRNLATQEKTVELTRRRQQGGFTTGLDVAAAEGQAASTAAQLPLLQSEIDQTIHAIALLLGEPPAALIAELAPVAPPASPPLPPLLLPADLLTRRPDIRQAEAKAHAATADIGIAEAAAYPSISLPGSIGFQSAGSRSLFDWPSRVWSIGPAISWRIFDGGAVQAEIAQKQAALDEMVLAYQAVVLSALHEVEDGLVAAVREEERGRELTRALAAHEKALDLALMLYREGQADYLAVLVAQRSVFSSEDTLAQSRRSLAGHVISLYKALGGGWLSEDR